MKLSTVGALAGLLALAATTATPAAAQQRGAARPASAAAPAAKVAFIDSQAILRTVEGYAQAESTYRKELEGIRSEVDRLQAQYDSARTALDQSSVVLSPTQKAAKQKELEDQGQKAQQRVQELQAQAARRERELLDPLQQKVNRTIDAVRADGGYALVFDVAAPNSGIVSVDKQLDLTQQVITRLKTAK